MNKVERAIIMAAGMGNRMKPVSLETPKPLINVNGVTMIESIIKALYKNEITEIYVVVGYMKDKFKILEEKYENLNLIYNPYYDKCNNISSLYVVRDYLENTFIIDGDQIIYNESILNPYFDLSGYNAVWCNDYTNEWLMEVNEGVVTSCSRDGGSKGWQLFSISRWSKEDGKKLKKHLEYEFDEKNNRQIYWDDVVMFQHFKDYKLGIYEMNYNDIIEIDNYEELIEIDERYIDYSKRSIN